MKFEHKSIMLEECMDFLKLNDNGAYFDGTLGGGGHSLEILKRTSNTKLLAIDKDSDALMSAAERLSDYKDRTTFLHDDFKNAVKHIEKIFPDGLDGAILDLGMSSYQIDCVERGFSYMNDALLDMRMNTTQYLTAFNVINEYSEYDLAKIFFEYGEERFSRRIASAIIKARETMSIRTTSQLVAIIDRCIPGALKHKGGHPAKRVFQAVRIEVNGELEGLGKAIEAIALSLKKGGRMCVLTFHSLEDRIVKNVFRTLELDCICDKTAPICVCNKIREAKVLTRKPIIASEKEISMNSRASSAKLRVIERV